MKFFYKCTSSLTFSLYTLITVIQVIPKMIKNDDTRQPAQSRTKHVELLANNIKTL